MIKSTTVFPDSKNHYEVLDGLRGVAAIMVVLFHILEIFSGGDHTKQLVNHGYLSVDFFFLLSGFVIAHAYDDRWNKMTIKQFFKRRLIRLHPMIIAGMTVGAVCFYFSAAKMFPAVAGTPVWKLLLVYVIGLFLIPVPLSLDIRGWTEMYPLNGPAWSLFYEYVANLLYAFILRRLSNTILAVMVTGAAIMLAIFTITRSSGDIIGGWALTMEQMQVGFIRLLYPFMAGLLLRRLFKPIKLNYGFLICSLLVILFLSFPRIGGHGHLWMNGVYDSFTILIVFPIIVFLGAGSSIKSKPTMKVCTFLGDISYPLYITHFPVLYIFYAWVGNNNIPLGKAWPVGILVFIAVIALAYLFFKLYDLPVRKWLVKKMGNK